MLPQAASEFYRAQQRLIVATLALTRREWAQMGAEFDASWAQVGPRLTILTASAQLGAARNGVRSVPATLDELGQSVDAEASVNVRNFAGVAADGRALDTLLYGAVIQAKTVEAQSAAERLTAGGRWLDMAVHTAVADAGRQAAQVDEFTRPRVGHVRAVNPPCCQRCAVLAGKWAKSDVAFQRHPRCDCFNIPTTDPRSITATLIGPEDVKDLTIAQRTAISDGADFNRVVNSHRAGKRDGLTTTEGAKRGQRRLTPEGIYRLAADRAEALRLLEAHGYLL